MRTLPVSDPGLPDHRSAGHYLRWLARLQWRTLVAGAAFGIVSMACIAVMPAAIGRAIDHGVAGDDAGALIAWALAILALGVVQAATGIMRHRFAVVNFLTAAYTTVQVVTRHTVSLGAALPRRVSTGEVVSIGSSDISHLGQLMDIVARFSAAIVSFLLVSVIMLRASWSLGLLVLIGVPAMMALIAPLLRPLQRRAAAQRELTGSLNATAADIVAGLRVLRGIGGEAVFETRYRRKSQAARQAGVRLASVQSVLDAMQVLLPGVLIVVVVWAGGNAAVSGRISVGELVAFYGYSTFLMIPLRTVTEFANKFIRARVSAARVCRVLALEPDHREPAHPDPSPAFGSDLVDPASGLQLTPGALTALVCEDPDAAAALADRLGLIAPRTVDDTPAVLWGGVPLDAVPLGEVRRRIVVSDVAATLFSGRLADVLDPSGHRDVTGALEVASALDVLEAVPDGLDSVVSERGRSFSGGQRQRLVLARALLLDPEILVLVEPTSAVDAHTESRIAARLRESRKGRTTVVVSCSPLLLDAADEVAFLAGDRVVAQGPHRELLQRADYRAVVSRAEGEDDQPGSMPPSGVGVAS